MTLEDLLEEIVGEIRDEYDREERGPVERLPDGSMVIQRLRPTKDLKSDFNLPFEESLDWHHTLAGFVLARLQRIPRAGERVEYNGYRLTIVDMEGRRIVKIKLEQAQSLIAATGLESPHADSLVATDLDFIPVRIEKINRGRFLATAPQRWALRGQKYRVAPNNQRSPKSPVAPPPCKSD